MAVNDVPRLHLVVDPDVVSSDLLSAPRLAAIRDAAMAVGAAVQLRIKSRPERISALARAFEGCVVVVNAGDVAFDSSGVHLTARAVLRAPPRPTGLFGASVHDETELRRAEELGVDYVFFGPVFDAGSKPLRGVGVAALARIVESTDVPVVAIGGVTPERIEACLEAGARGVATITNVLMAADPAAVIHTFNNRLKEQRRCRT